MRRPGDCSKDTKAEAIERQDYRCAYCSEPFTAEDKIHAHHITSIEAGKALGMTPEEIASLDNIVAIHGNSSFDDCSSGKDKETNCHEQVHGDGLFGRFDIDREHLIPNGADMPPLEQDTPNAETTAADSPGTDVASMSDAATAVEATTDAGSDPSTPADLTPDAEPEPTPDSAATDTASPDAFAADASPDLGDAGDLAWGDLTPDPGFELSAVDQPFADLGNGDASEPGAFDATSAGDFGDFEGADLSPSEFPRGDLGGQGGNLGDYGVDVGNIGGGFRRLRRRLRQLRR
jgi:hypothetical protein